MSYNRYSQEGPWEYEMFTEVLTAWSYPEKKFALIHPNDQLPMGMVQDYDHQLARLIEKAARNLLQRAGEQGWEPVDAVDADSLLANGRVRFEGMRDLKERADGGKKVEPTTIHIFCRRRVQLRSSVMSELSTESNPALKHLEMW
jgi:hypothetical protein